MAGDLSPGNPGHLHLPSSADDDNPGHLDWLYDSTAAELDIGPYSTTPAQYGSDLRDYWRARCSKAAFFSPPTGSFLFLNSNGSSAWEVVQAGAGRDALW
ncbi:hypothetical protein B0H10DRAFT_2228307 [Mycena sp. CBHHK59/15]|nr:hypothetical protein B0H10DRAFT_2228307 [Mycena sp. CBHHK59/15]